MKKFYTLNVEKFKKVDVVGVAKHNTRDFREVTTKEKNSKNKNVDFSRSENNLSFGVKNSNDFEEKLNSIIRDGNEKQVLKSNTNLFIGFVISASPQYFFKGLQPPENLSDEQKEVWQTEKLKWWDNLNANSKDPKKAIADKKSIADIWKTLDKNAFEDWKKAVVEFSKDDEFKNLIISFDIHMDEKTPHAHITVCPKMENKKVDCKNFFTKESLERWRQKLEVKFTPLGLERAKEEPMPRDDQEQHYKALAGAIEPEPAPEVEVPPPMLPSSLEQKEPLFGKDKVLISKIELEKLERNFKKRETAQGKKYNFYKQFYENNKFNSAYVKKLENKNLNLTKENNKMKGQIKKLTDEQMENLRHIPLNEVCQQLGFEVKKESREFYRVKTENLNLVLNTDKNSFSENKNSNNGFGAINLLVKVFGYTAKQAIEFLSGKFQPEQITKTILANPELTTSVLNETVEKINDEIPKAKEINLPKIEEYLISRGVKKEIIKTYSRQGLIFADNKNNLVITNPNKTFAIVRGTIKLKNGEKNTFKANKGKMDFIKFQNTENPKKLYVFESAIDALAFQSLNENAKGVFVSTNGNAMINRLDELKLNEFDKVIACFDNDEQGEKFTEKLRSKVDKDKFEVKKPEQKDFADDAQQFFKVLEKWAKEDMDKRNNELERLEKVNQVQEEKKPTAPAPTPFDSKLRFGKPKI